VEDPAATAAGETDTPCPADTDSNLADPASAATSETDAHGPASTDTAADLADPISADARETDTPEPTDTATHLADPISAAAGEIDAPSPADTGWAARLADDVEQRAAASETDTPRPAGTGTGTDLEDLVSATAGETDTPRPDDTDTAATAAAGSGEHPAEGDDRGGDREPVAQTGASTKPGPAAEPVSFHAPVNPSPARAAGASAGVPVHPAAAAHAPAGPRVVGPWFAGLRAIGSWFAGPRAAETEWAGPISAEAARRLACDAIITRVITYGASQPLDVGRRTRTIPSAIRTALTVRDRGCAWPGCDRPPPWTDAHHIIPWANGGPTNLDNLVLLCRRHHRTVHEGRWKLTRTPNGQWVTAPPERPSPATTPTTKRSRRRIPP